MTNRAIVCRIAVRPHPNADRLQIGNALGNQVIVGLDTKDGDLGVYIPTDSQLSVEFARANDLIRRKDESGNNAGGMFDENRKVRAQAFRGVKSDGFWFPVHYLLNAGVSIRTVESLDEGFTFNELDKIVICNKYETPATIRAKANVQNAKASKKLVNFPEHVDSLQYRFVKDKIVLGSIITITEKLHGTSFRYGNVEVHRTLTWFEKLLKRFGVRVQETEYKHVIGTRRVVLGDADNGTSYYVDESFRRNAVKGIALRPGEVVYGELVGYTTTGALIMGAHDTTKLDKSFVKQYGPKMQYTYGCAPGECKAYVYRITHYGVELSHNQMVARCRELGLNTVPVVGNTVVLDNVVVTHASLDAWVNALMTGASTLDNRHIREGVVLRVEDETGTQYVKSKSWEFGVMEGYIKADDNYVDTEEIS